MQLRLVFPCRPGIFREGTQYSYVEILNLQLRANIYCMCPRYIRSWALEVPRQTRHGPFSERACSGACFPSPGTLLSDARVAHSLTLSKALLGCLGSASGRRCSLSTGPESRPQLPALPGFVSHPLHSLPPDCQPASLLTTHLNHYDVPWTVPPDRQSPAPCPAYRRRPAELPIEQINKEQP